MSDCGLGHMNLGYPRFCVPVSWHFYSNRTKKVINISIYKHSDENPREASSVIQPQMLSDDILSFRVGGN